MRTALKSASYQRLCITLWITFGHFVDLYPTYAQVIHIFVHICGKLHACNLFDIELKNK